jgi:hypothetical protein
MMRSQARFIKVGIIFALCLVVTVTAFAAYHHAGETDSDIFSSVYPDTDGTKLDSCAVCHSGGQYVNNKGKLVSLGSCQWCHYVYKYDGSGDIEATLNPYGIGYRDNGRIDTALISIEDLDSDGDGFSNIEEITALRFPGNNLDDPSKVTAPYRIYSRDELEGMPQHTQFLLMNTPESPWKTFLTMPGYCPPPQASWSMPRMDGPNTILLIPIRNPAFIISGARILKPNSIMMKRRMNP